MEIHARRIRSRIRHRSLWHSLRVPAAVAVFAWLVVTGSPATAANGDHHAVDLVGRYAAGICRDIEVRRVPHQSTIPWDTAYVADGGQLELVDFTLGQEPRAISRIVYDGVVYGLAEQGNRVYAAVAELGLRIIDVSDPLVPVEIGAFDTPGSAREVWVENGLAYVADADSGLRIIDVSDPTAPVEVGALVGGWKALDVAVMGGHAYVAADLSGMRAIDVTNPAAPQEVGSYDVGGRALRIDVSTTATIPGRPTVFIANRIKGLHILDVTDPSAPAVRGVFDASSVEDVSIEGTQAFLACGSSGVRVVDVSDPATPFEMYHVPMSYSTIIAASQQTLVFVGASDGVHALDPMNPYNNDSMYITGVTAFDVDVMRLEKIPGMCPGTQSDSADAMFVAGGTAGHGGVRVVDVSDPMLPIRTGGFGVPEITYAVAAHEFINGALLAGFRLLTHVRAGMLCDIQKGDTARVPPGVNPWDAVVLDPNSIYVASGDGGGGGRVDRYQFLGAGGGVLEGPIATYATDGPAMRIDYNPNFDPSIMLVAKQAAGVETVFLGSLGIGHVTQLYNGFALATARRTDPTWNAIVAIASGSEGIRLFRGDGSISLDQPDSLGAIVLDGPARDVAFVGEYLFVAADSAGIRVVDTTDPTQPVEVGYYDTGARARRLTVVGNRVFVADLQDGVYILEYVGNNPVPALLRTFDGLWTGRGIELQWRVSEDPVRATYVVRRSRLDRVEEDVSMRVAADGSGQYTLLDANARPGGDYQYTLSVLETGRHERTLAKTHVRVPAPATLGLGPISPNPVTGATRIAFDLPAPDRISLDVYDVAGRRVRTLLDGALDAGTHEVKWFGRDRAGRRVAAGVYFVRLSVRNRVLTRKVVVVK